MNNTAIRLGWLLAGLLLVLAGLSGQNAKPDLILGPGDIRIDQSIDGGYLLLVRKKADIQSVILTESTADPQRKLDSYTLRAKERNPVNGDEKRRLNGKFVESPGMFFLLSSTPVDDPDFGKAFRIFIPYVVVFGYPNARYGEINMLDGAYLNIRTFAMPYAEYAGGFRDNPYTLRLSQKSTMGKAAAYNKEALKAYQSLVGEGRGTLVLSKGEADLPRDLGKLLAALPAGRCDLAVCLDSTKSMETDAQVIRSQLFAVLREFQGQRPGSRLALVQFRDYMEDFLYKVTPFGNDPEIIGAQLADYAPAEGRDIPEALYEGVHACLTELDWAAEGRRIILLGDGPPHPMPRGSVSADMVIRGLRDKAVVLDALLLPE